MEHLNCSRFVRSALAGILLLVCLYACKTTEPEPEKPMGQAMFWIAQDLACGNIAVSIDGQTEMISGYNSSGTPECGSSGTATFDLNPGTYTYSASCNGLTWNGSVTISSGLCYKTKLTGTVSNNSNNKSGQTMFWLSSDLGCGNITVNVSGISKTITGFNASGAPACGSSGPATFDLAPGTYSYSASCTGLTWNGSVTVTSGQCFKTQLTGTPTTTTKGQAMFWVSSDFGCGNITVKVGGLSQVITGFSSSGTPACGTSGAASFDLAPGTYTYTAACSGKTWNGSVTVTAGQCFKTQFTTSGGETGNNSGQVMFWSQTDFKCGNVSVTCNGVTRTLSSFYSSGAPACGASGAATFDFSPGTYSFSAKCSSKTWTGNVTVSKGGCFKLQLTP